MSGSTVHVVHVSLQRVCKLIVKPIIYPIAYRTACVILSSPVSRTILYMQLWSTKPHSSQLSQNNCTACVQINLFCIMLYHPGLSCLLLFICLLLLCIVYCCCVLFNCCCVLFIVVVLQSIVNKVKIRSV